MGIWEKGSLKASVGCSEVEVVCEVDGIIISLVWKGGLDCFFLLFLMEVATIVEGVKVSILEYSGLVVKMGVVKIVFLGCRLKICGVWL